MPVDPAPREPQHFDVSSLPRLTRHVVHGPHAATIKPIAPFTGEPIAELPLSTPADVEVAFATAREAQRAWAHRPVGERVRVLRRLHDLVFARRHEIMDLIQLESGKKRLDALEEVVDVAINARYYARTAPALLSPQKRTGFVPLLTSVREYRHPKGVVGVIVPWNYPFTLAISDSLPALAAGNAVVMKPDHASTFSALLGKDLLVQAGFPEGLVQVVAGEGPVIGPELIDRADFVMFTGSTKTGREVAARAAARLVGTSLELGGKNAMLVLDDAPLHRTVRGTLRAAFSNAGQLCESMERLYVADAIYDKYVPALLRAVDGMRMTADFGYTADIGSLASEAQLGRVKAHVDDAVARGAKVLAGGRPRPDIGPFYFEPTVLENVDDQMKVCAEETFGPVVSLYRFTDVDDAIARANDTAFGLNAAVFTGDVERGRQIAQQLRAGTVNVNEGFGAVWGSTDAPLGGMGASGIGRRHGAEGLLKYTDAQSVGVQRIVDFSPLPWVPQEWFAQAMVAGLRVLERTGRR
jgi:succinate-semialdehyde dehydrogenase / glutarate-semialdehyde dehydrogenase